jgi:Glutathione S-transferase, C-terminal domain
MLWCCGHPYEMSNQQLLPRVASKFLGVSSADEGTLSIIHRFLCGDQVTEADVRLFPTLFRFDHIYYNRFLLNRTMIRDSYPALQVQVMLHRTCVSHSAPPVQYKPCTGAQVAPSNRVHHSLTNSQCTCRGGCRTSGACQAWQLRATLSTASGATSAARATT